ncbi:MAG TPA: hypothetical protein PKI61_03685 [bacterium]|nr:hypothetical protein [bacterium]HPT29809.1 hypothetical protein [bacterium]
MNFFNRYKKIIYIALFVLAVILIATFIWRAFFKTKITTIPTPTGTTTTPGELPTAGEGGQQVSSTTPGTIPGAGTIPGISGAIPTTGPQVTATAQGGLTKVTPLNGGRALNPLLSSDGKNIQYYNQTDGKFYKINEKGEMVALSDKVFYNVKTVDWAPNGSKAVLEYPDGSNIVYDFNSQKQVTLPKHWEDFSFSKDSNQLVSKSLGTDPDNRWLITSNSDGSNSKVIEYIGENDEKVISSWSPNNQTIALYTEGIDFNRQQLFFVGQNGENFKSTIVEGRDVRAKWTPTGDRLLYSAYNSNSDLKPELWIVGAQGENIGAARTDLKINTWADKCTFATATEIYCAVPESLERGAGMLPDLALKTKDNLYKIDVTTGAKKLIAIPNGSFNINSLVVTKDQSQLYFTDQTSNQVYAVSLR